MSELFKHIPLPAQTELFLNPDWGQDRQLLRRALQQSLRDEMWEAFITLEELHRVLDLEQVPCFHQLFVSISHTKGLGGFVISRQAVGLDFENAARVREALARRISSEEELHTAPSPGFLWAAKEAAYKALLSFHQPKVISEIAVGEWSLEKDVARFVLRDPQKYGVAESRGLVELQDGILAALCFLSGH